MADFVVNDDGTYPTLNAAVAVASAANTIEIQGTWDNDDTTSVVWDVAVIVTADSDSKQIGKPFVSGDTHYRHREGAGHAFTVTAAVDITDLDIQSDSSGTSDELFRAAGDDAITLKNCMLGFTGNTDQPDVVYNEDNSTKTYLFEQCFFYDVGRSIVDVFGSGTGTHTVNFNSCGSFNIGANGGRAEGCWYGHTDSGTNDTVNVNMHNCLIHVTDENAVTIESGSSGTYNSDCAHSITNITSANLVDDFDTDVQTSLLVSATWATSTAGGDEVLLTNITSTTYDPALVNDSTNNDAQTRHATVTDAGLTIPDLDILGQTRDKATPSFDCGPHALTLAAAGGGPAGGKKGVIALLHRRRWHGGVPIAA